MRRGLPPPSSSYQLPLLHVEIFRHELGAQVFVLEQRKAHPATLQNFFQLTQLVPENVPPQLLVNLVERRDVRVRKKRAHAGRLKHVHQDQVLPANQVQIPHKALGQHRVVERSQEHQQRAPAQAQPNETAKFIEVRRDDLRLQRVNRVAAGGVVRLAAFGADELLHLVAERQQAEEVALLFGGQAENQSSGDEAFQNG